MILKEIAIIKNDFKSKFGVPRQSRRVPKLLSNIVFEKEFCNIDAFRGLEEYSHIWLIWGFNQNKEDSKYFRPTVRPPRLGGNKRIGVFATRSPYRPNPIGLTLVKIEKLEKTPQGVQLVVSGADLIDGTPIYDIKPYLPTYESIEDAKGGLAESSANYYLDVKIDDLLYNKIPQHIRDGLIEILKNDPRPAYQKNPQRRYGLSFADFEIAFSVDGNILTVLSID